MKKSLVKKAMAGILVGAMAFSIVACGNKSAKVENQNSLDQIKKAGKIVIGTSADYPPYEFHKKVDGKDEIVGFDIEIAKAIAKDLGVQVEFKDMKFDGLLAALTTNKVDMVIAGMNPTDERKKSIDFSEVYYNADNGILVKAEDKDKIKNLADLSGKKIAVQKGSVQADLATKQIKGAEIKQLGRVTDLVMELKSGKVDAIVTELPVANFYIDKNKDLAVSQANFEVNKTEQGSAIAFKKNSKELVDEVNKTLDKLMKDKQIEKFVIDANNMVEAQ